jgi:integrative and conjugative element protein (TIGR02256 family)
MKIVMSVMDETVINSKDDTLYITSNVIDMWRNHRQLSINNKESFGVLIGSQSGDVDEIWIERCTEPKTKDRATRSSFMLKDPVHQKEVDISFTESDGKLGYIGTWHTHPENSPSPSQTDLNDWRECLNRNNDRTLIFVIVGLSDFCIYRFKGKRFNRIMKEKIDD